MMNIYQQQHLQQQQQLLQQQQSGMGGGDGNDHLSMSLQRQQTDSMLASLNAQGGNFQNMQQMSAGMTGSSGMGSSSNMLGGMQSNSGGGNMNLNMQQMLQQQQQQQNGANPQQFSSSNDADAKTGGDGNYSGENKPKEGGDDGTNQGPGSDRKRDLDNQDSSEPDNKRVKTDDEEVNTTLTYV